MQTARLKFDCLLKGNTCPVNNYSIVASRGELARNNYAVRETSSAQCIVVKRNKTAVNAGNETRPKLRDDLLKEQSSGKQLSKDFAGPTDFGKSQRPIRKSFSVPDYLREGTCISNPSDFLRSIINRIFRYLNPSV